MRKPDVLEEEPTNMTSVREELQRIEERDEELSFRGNRTMDYLNEFVELDADEAEDLVQDLKSLEIARLKDEFIHKIVDGLPKNIDELEVLLQGYTLSLEDEDKQQVLEVVQEYI